MSKDEDKMEALERLRLASVGVVGKGRPNAKFPLIKSALAETCRALPAGSRLPSIRQIAAVLGATLVPVQRAVNELKREGVIESKHRSGLYRGGSALRPSADPMPGMSGSKQRVRFLTDSDTPAHRALWSGIVADFMAAQDHIAVEVDYRSLEDGLPAEFLPDVFEGVEWSYYRHFHDMPLLRLESFIGKHSGLALVGDGLACAYYLSVMLFHHPTALERLGMPPPSQLDCAGLTEYCRELRRAGGLAISATQPMLLGGGLTRGLLLALQAESSLELVHERFDALLELAACFKYRVDKTEREYPELFESGEAALYLCNSNYLWELRGRQNSFAPGVGLVANLDGELVKMPVAVAALDSTSNPVECVRWIKHLLSASIQGKLADFGYFTDSSPPLGDGRFAGAPSIFAPTYQEHYVGLYILNAEIWDCLSGRQSADEAWDNVLSYTKAYLARQRQQVKRKL